MADVRQVALPVPCISSTSRFNHRLKHAVRFSSKSPFKNPSTERHYIFVSTTEEAGMQFQLLIVALFKGVADIIITYHDAGVLQGNHQLTINIR